MKTLGVDFACKSVWPALCDLDALGGPGRAFSEDDLEVAEKSKRRRFVTAYAQCVLAEGDALWETVLSTKTLWWCQVVTAESSPPDQPTMPRRAVFGVAPAPG